MTSSRSKDSAVPARIRRCRLTRPLPTPWLGPFVPRPCLLSPPSALAPDLPLAAPASAPSSTHGRASHSAPVTSRPAAATSQQDSEAVVEGWGQGFAGRVALSRVTLSPHAILDHVSHQPGHALAESSPPSSMPLSIPAHVALSGTRRYPVLSRRNRIPTGYLRTVPRVGLSPSPGAWRNRVPAQVQETGSHSPTWCVSSLGRLRRRLWTIWRFRCPGYSAACGVRLLASRGLRLCSLPRRHDCKYERRQNSG